MPKTGIVMWMYDITIPTQTPYYLWFYVSYLSLEFDLWLISKILAILEVPHVRQIIFSAMYGKKISGLADNLCGTVSVPTGYKNGSISKIPMSISSLSVWEGVFRNPPYPSGRFLELLEPFGISKIREIAYAHWSSTIPSLPKISSWTHVSNPPRVGVIMFALSYPHLHSRKNLRT